MAKQSVTRLFARLTARMSNLPIRSREGAGRLMRAGGRQCLLGMACRQHVGWLLATLSDRLPIVEPPFRGRVPWLSLRFTSHLERPWGLIMFAASNGNVFIHRRFNWLPQRDEMRG